MATNRTHIALAAAVAAAALAGAPSTAGSAPAGPIVDISATNGSSPYAGDRRLLTTISPNGDGFRDRALIHVRLVSPATVDFQVTRTQIHPEPVFARTVHLGIGAHTLIWAPPAGTE